jgi:hypothetical protein
MSPAPCGAVPFAVLTRRVIDASGSGVFRGHRDKRCTGIDEHADRRAVDRVLEPWREMIAFVRSTSSARVHFDLIESTLGTKLSNQGRGVAEALNSANRDC